jgi:hypothetical protein
LQREKKREREGEEREMREKNREGVKERSLEKVWRDRKRKR